MSKTECVHTQVCYLCDSETEQVEWLSALEGTVLRIVRSAAGVDEEAATAAAAAATAKSAKPARSEQQHNSEWARKLEAGFSSASTRSSSRGGGAADMGGNPMVKVVGFDSAGQDDYGGAQPSRHADYSSSGAGYSSIAGWVSVAEAANLEMALLSSAIAQRSRMTSHTARLCLQVWRCCRSKAGDQPGAAGVGQLWQLPAAAGVQRQRHLRLCVV